MREIPGLTERADVDAVVLDLVQLPVAAWVLPLFAALVAGFVAASYVPALLPVWAVGFLAVIGAMGWGTSRPPRLRVQISPEGVALRGWLGVLPRPARTAVPLRGAAVSWRDSALVNGVQLRVLHVEHRGRVVAVAPGLRCTEEELVALRDRIEGMQALEAALRGAPLDDGSA